MVQCRILFTVVNSTSESYSVNLINSTAFLMISEISPIHSQAINSLLIAKHIALWVWRLREERPYQCFPSYGVSGICCIRRLQTKQLAEEKEVEEQRLESLVLLCRME